jgi:DNA-binding beta-propeller fold protein YncE
LDSVATGGGSVWVTSEGGELVRINESTLKVDRRITVPDARLKGLAIIDGVAWVADCYGRIIRARSNSDQRSIPIPGHPRSVAASGNLLYVAVRADGQDRNCDRKPNGEVANDKPLSGDGRILVLNTDANGAFKTVATIADPTAVVVAKNMLWVADQDAGLVWRIDPSTGDRRSVDTESPEGLAVDETGVWALNRPSKSEHGVGTVTHIDPDAVTQIGEPIRVPGGPHEIAAGGGFVWVTQSDQATVRILQPQQ